MHQCMSLPLGVARSGVKETHALAWTLISSPRKQPETVLRTVPVSGCLDLFFFLNFALSTSTRTVLVQYWTQLYQLCRDPIEIPQTRYTCTLHMSWQACL